MFIRYAGCSLVVEFLPRVCQELGSIAHSKKGEGGKTYLLFVITAEWSSMKSTHDCHQVY